jgi:hypothetical protein
VRYARAEYRRSAATTGLDDFGTAYPSRPLRETVAPNQEWDWNPGVLEKVFYRNAYRLMKMD